MDGTIPAGIVNGVGVIGLVVILFWLLATGRLATGRELREKDKRIEALEKALDHRDRQVDAVFTDYLPAANSVMRALHEAAAAEEAKGT